MKYRQVIWKQALGPLCARLSFAGAAAGAVADATSVDDVVYVLSQVSSDTFNDAPCPLFTSHLLATAPQ
eukprot:COSAG01_NODE_41879_length_446_cov_0.778098_1_plen_69_part_10